MLINHGGGLFTSYSHMSDWVAEEGDYVEVKELIGKVGSSGRVTGPHLHWVVYLNGNRINPELLVDCNTIRTEGKTFPNHFLIIYNTLCN